VNGILHFDFHDASDAPLIRLTATFPSNDTTATWVLTPNPAITIPDVGRLHVVAAAGTTGTWRRGGDQPTIGTQDPAVGSAGAGQAFKFALTNTAVNTIPTIASLSDSPDPIAGGAGGGTVTLTANGVTDNGGAIANVRFYREVNGVAGIQAADTLLVTDSAAPFTTTFSSTSLTNGKYTYYAQATDTTGLVGDYVTTTHAVGLGSISGTVWNDANNNRAFDAGEAVLPDWTVFLDQDHDRVLDAGEASTTSNASGVYSFTGLAPDTYFVTTVMPTGWQQTFPGGTGQISADAAGDVIADPTPPLPPAPPITTTGSAAPIYPTDAESNRLVRQPTFLADPRFSNLAGQGFSVAVLDTGIDVNHPFFGPDANGNGVADRIVFQHDFANGDTNAQDPTAGSGHGTNVASIVGSANAAFPGVAPAVNLIALKVFTDAGAGNFAFIEQALQWCVANAAAFNLAAINMSLGDNVNYNTATSNPDYGINDELAALAAQGVIVVSAAGNDFRKFNSQQGVSYPAADPNSLAVSATFDSNVGQVSWGSGPTASTDTTTAQDRVASFSQRSSALTDIFAPGAMITGGHADGGTVEMGGTSQAAPHIAGIAALVQQLAVRDLGRKLTPAEFRTFMRDSAATIIDGDDENDSVTNTGASFKRVDLVALAETIRALATSPFSHTVNLSAGEVAGSINFGNRSSDTTAPTADIVNVSPDPRQTSVALVTVNFSEPVTGVGASDFSLQRDGGAVTVSAAPFQQVTPSQYTIDLSAFTADAGKYLLTLNATGSGIQDAASNPMTASASDDWLRNAVDGTGVGDAMRIVRSGGVINVFVNNATATPNYAVNVANLGASQLFVQGLAGNDTITVDFAGGVPAPAAGLNVNGGSHAAADTLVLAGTAAGETATFTATSFNFGTTPIAYSGVEAHAFHGGAGADTLNVNGGVFNFNADASATTSNLALNVAAAGTVHFNASQHLAALTVNGNADLAAGGGAKVIVTKALNVSGGGRLDLRNHDLLLDYDAAAPPQVGSFDGTSYGGITGLLAAAYNFGGWDLPGLTSSDAAASSSVTTLALAEAADVLFLNPGDTGVFAGETVDATTVVVKYTYTGDLNLDGLLDGADYGTIDNYVQFPGTNGYNNGDFNFDGVIDGADYGLIDNAIQFQGDPL
jgi:subtilisin family serine protease